MVVFPMDIGAVLWVVYAGAPTDGGPFATRPAPTVRSGLGTHSQRRFNLIRAQLRGDVFRGIM